MSVTIFVILMSVTIFVILMSVLGEEESEATEA